MSDELFLVTGRDDFIRGDEGSLVLCRSCFEADQTEGFAHFAKDTFVFKAWAFLPVDQLECEGHRCCKAHHGQACVDAKQRDLDCRHEYQYAERRNKTRDKLRDCVINRRIANLEGIVALVINVLSVAAWVVLWSNTNAAAERLFGPIFGWGFWIVGAVVITWGSRYLLFGTVRRKLRLPT